MKKCRICSSCAINPKDHGRQEGFDEDLCDVCYWRTRAEEAQRRVEDLEWLWTYQADLRKKSSHPERRFNLEKEEGKT